MLWYRNWLETMPWAGFVSFILLGFLFLLTAIFNKSSNMDPGATFVFPMLSTSAFLFLAGSGVRSQPNIFQLYLSSKESATFTLSLPISRTWLLLSRAAVGLVEAFLISTLFTIFYFGIAHAHNSVGSAGLACYLIKISAAGFELYFFSTFLATFLNDFYHKSAMCLIPLLLSIYSAQGYIPPPLNPLGMLQPPIDNAFPWIAIMWSLALGCLLLLASLKVVESQEF